MRINLNDLGEMYQFSILSQFQQAANNIVESYDFNDIKTAMAHAKESTEKVKTGGFNESISVVRELFVKTLDWLEANGRKF